MNAARRRADSAATRHREGRPGTARRSADLLLAVLALAASATSLTAAEPGARFRLEIAPATSLEAARAVQAARDAEAEEQFPAALAAWRSAIQQHGSALVEIDHGRFLRVRDWANLCLSAWPDDAQAPVQQHMDAEASSLLRTALAEQDEPRLLEAASRFILSSQTDEAIDLLGTLAWRRGDLDAAERWWLLLLPAEPAAPSAARPLRRPSSKDSAAEVRARLILCTLFRGDREAARSAVERFAEVHPDAQGRLGARTGRLAELLEEFLAEESSDTASNAPSPHGVAPSDPWRVAISTGMVEPGGAPRPLRLRRPMVVPVVSGPHVIINDASGVRGLQLLSGAAAWPATVGATDDAPAAAAAAPSPAASRDGQGDERSQEIDGGWLLTTPDDVGEADAAGARRLGAPVYAAVASNDGRRVFALHGLPIVRQGARDLRDEPARLACLDIGTFEGRLAWMSAPGDLNPGDAWRFAGTPVVVDEDLFIAIERTTPQPELGVVRLRTTDGSLVWLSPVCGLFDSGMSESSEYGCRTLLAAAGQLFLATDHGAVAALDARDGAVRWISAAPHDVTGDRGPSGARAPAGSLAWRRGRLLHTPGDSGQISAWDAETGGRIWLEQLPEPGLTLAGVQGGRVYVAGARVWALDFETGQPLWRVGFDDAAGRCAGNAVLNGDRIAWTTREELLEASIEDGRLLRRTSLRERFGMTGGRLTRAPGGWLLTTAEHLLALPEAAW